MECMGACANAPMITIADYSSGVEGFSYKYFEDLSPQDAVDIVAAYQKGEKPKAGTHAFASCPCAAGGGSACCPGLARAAKRLALALQACRGV